MGKGLQLHRTLEPARYLVRRTLGQIRPVVDSGNFLLVGLRKGAAEREQLLDALERRLTSLSGVSGAWFVPPLGAMVIRLEQESAAESMRGTVVDRIAEAEDQAGIGFRRFPTSTGLPDVRAASSKLYTEMALDLAGFGTGLLLRRVGSRPFYFFSAFSAVNQVMGYTPETRRYLDAALGTANAELVLQIAGTLGEALSEGWSGSLVDLRQRWLQWQSEAATARCWQAMAPDILASIARLPAGLRQEPGRAQPVRAGAIERYREAAENVSVAAFSAGMVFTRDLNRSVATLFSSVPRPAIHGPAAYRLALIRELADNGVLVLDAEVLSYLDRIDRIVVDARIISATRTMATARFPDASSPVPLEYLVKLLEHPKQTLETGDSRYSSVQPRARKSVPGEIRAWWESTGRPLPALRLIKRDGRVCDAVVVEQVTDHTVESLLRRARIAGLKVTVFNDEKNTRKKIRRWQAQNETILGLGCGSWLGCADIAVGLLQDSALWLRGAHLITREPLDTLWRLIMAIENARTGMDQSVELSRMDAFSGLVLSLQPMDKKVVNRMRLAADLASAAALFNGQRLGRKNSGLPEKLLDDPTPWHAMERDMVIQWLEYEQHGEAAEPPSSGENNRSLAGFWLEEMRNPLVPVLISGTGLAALTGAVGDAALIASVIALNGLVGGLQRRNTERQLGRLGMTSRAPVSVRRKGKATVVDQDELCPGDGIFLVAGDRVPADARILSSSELEVDESSLTGESLPVSKSPEPVRSVNLAERTSMLYEGTTLVRGEADAVVVAPKNRSHARRAQYIAESRSTGVETRLEKLAQMTVPVAGLSGVALMVRGLAGQKPVQEVVSSGISLAIAAVPEGLPILATLSQLAAAGRLGSQGVVARNPRAVEALGRMTVLCADKTGTLTEGNLALRYITVGESTQAVDSLERNAAEVLLTSRIASPEASDDEAALSHATDRALKMAAATHQPDLERQADEWERVTEMPFQLGQVYHATLVRGGNRKRICVKGAPDVILNRCNRWQDENGQTRAMNQKHRQWYESQYHELASQGLRILAVAERPVRGLSLDDEVVNSLIFRGYVALADPLRNAASESVARLREAGVKVKMVTGDHPETAAAIGRELGLEGDDSVLTGEQIDSMSDEDLVESACSVGIFARVTPAQKGRLVKALQDAGEVVGMTGDGANDSAAIRLADVGIALGRDCSESAQQAADLLVLDPRIETIVHAVQEGRALWSSVRDSVSLLVGGNLGEIGFNLMAGLFEGGSPLNARQLLLINLLTDTFPALAVALRRPQVPEATRLMAEGPESALGGSLTREIRWRAGLNTTVAAGTWALSRRLLGPERASTVGMLTVIGSQLAQTVVAGGASRNVLLTSAGSMAALGLVVQTPGVSRLFGCSRPGIIGWTLVGGALGVSFLGSRYLKIMEPEGEQLGEQLADSIRRWITRDD